MTNFLFRCSGRNLPADFIDIKKMQVKDGLVYQILQGYRGFRLVVILK